MLAVMVKAKAMSIMPEAIAVSFVLNPINKNRAKTISKTVAIIAAILPDAGDK